MRTRKAYTVLCISMYDDDLVAADALVTTLVRRGLTTANRSMLIRFALKELQISGALSVKNNDLIRDEKGI